MAFIRINTPTRSAVGSTNADITRPYDSVNAMAEVVLGAGTGTVSIQFSGSNDGTNYTSIGSAITSTNRSIPLSPNGEAFQFYRAATTISTNTKVTDITFYFA